MTTQYKYRGFILNKREADLDTGRCSAWSPCSEKEQKDFEAVKAKEISKFRSGLRE